MQEIWKAWLFVFPFIDFVLNPFFPLLYGIFPLSSTRERIGLIAKSFRECVWWTALSTEIHFSGFSGQVLYPELCLLPPHFSSSGEVNAFASRQPSGGSGPRSSFHSASFYSAVHSTGLSGHFCHPTIPQLGRCPDIQLLVRNFLLRQSLLLWRPLDLSGFSLRYHVSSPERLF